MKKGITSLISALVFTAVFSCPGLVTGTMNEGSEYASEEMMDPEEEITGDSDEPMNDLDEEEMEGLPEDNNYEEEELMEPEEEIFDDTDEPMRDYDEENPGGPEDEGEPVDPDADRA